MYVNKPNLGIITMGILIFAAVYLIPIPGIGTLAKNAEICSSKYFSLFSGCDPVFGWYFYITWVFAIFFIFLGILNKKEQ
jgi:hypothetical protein